jgi:SAM-dependent methyltransferase
MNRKKACNKIFKIILNSKKNTITNYDGIRIDFKNDYFDCIFSQQVIEHVQSKYLEYYISEEKRILKTKGFALHQIPHRLGPFEGHTKKWFIHWLPKNIYYYILKNDKQKLKLVKRDLFLRWPWELKAAFNKYFKSVNNLVNLRLKDDVFSGEYSMKEKIIRKALVFLFRLPILGKLFLKLFSVFFQLELLAKK